MITNVYLVSEDVPQHKGSVIALLTEESAKAYIEDLLNHKIKEMNSLGSYYQIKRNDQEHMVSLEPRDEDYYAYWYEKVPMGMNEN